LKPAQANSLTDLISKKKNPSQKRASGVAQGVGQYHQKKKKKSDIYVGHLCSD
jgi:hypothetical protein